MVLIHTFDSYKLLKGDQTVFEVKGVDSVSPDLTAFYGICHAIHYCLKNKINETIESNSKMAVKWVKEEKTTIETKRTREALKYLKSIPTKKTLNIEFV